MDNCFGPITNTLIEKILNQIKKKKTKQKVMNNIIEPFVKDFTFKYYPYFLFVFITLIIIIILQIAILTVIIIK